MMNNKLKFNTIDEWNEAVWMKAGFIYKQTFEDKGAKPEAIIRNMFQKGICTLHVCYLNDQMVAMALTGELKGINGLLIDYLAVHPDFQQQGIGKQMVDYIKEWSLCEKRLGALIIEVESEKTPENLERIHFWQKCGFILTDYIHHYIWVPEPYQAMYVSLTSDDAAYTGEELFRHIGKFHKSSFQRKK